MIISPTTPARYIPQNETSSGHQWSVVDRESFGKAEHQVHVLYGLSCSALHQIIRYRQYYGSIASLRAVDGDAAKI